MNLADSLRRLDYNALDISNYSRDYILRLLPTLDYYLDICHHALDLLSPQTHTLVDYGGGQGFLSLLAKRQGIQEVIYIDHNPQASQTVTTLSNHLGFGPDTILTGDQDTLLKWCREQHCTPDALVGIDVIEHIYRLEPFFDSLHTLNPRMTLVFTTASTPYNPFIQRRLKRIMLMDEYGHESQKGFLQLRREHIASLQPKLSEKELDYWARGTRGLTYDDITRLFHDNLSVESLPTTLPPHPNTCDPATGSWTERILPIDSYRQLTVPLGWSVSVGKGFFNKHHSGLKRYVSRVLNAILLLPCTRWLSPFIILKIK